MSDETTLGRKVGVAFAQALGATTCEPCALFFPSRTEVCPKCGQPTEGK